MQMGGALNINFSKTPICLGGFTHVKGDDKDDNEDDAND